MNEGDALLAQIRLMVSQRVPADQVETITELVARSVVAIMENPQFFYMLPKVHELRVENENLRQHLMLATAQLNRVMGIPMQPRKRPAKKKAAKKVPVKRAPTVRVKPSTKNSAFKRGARGA